MPRPPALPPALRPHFVLTELGSSRRSIWRRNPNLDLPSPGQWSSHYRIYSETDIYVALRNAMCEGPSGERPVGRYSVMRYTADGEYISLATYQSWGEMKALLPTYHRLARPVVIKDPRTGLHMLLSHSPRLSYSGMPESLVFLAGLVGGYPELTQEVEAPNPNFFTRTVARIRSASKSGAVEEAQIAEWRMEAMRRHDFKGSPDSLLQLPTFDIREWYDEWLKALRGTRFL